MGEYATNIKFKHIHIPISLNKINQVANNAIEKVKAYGKNVFQESVIHNYQDNQNVDTKGIKSMHN
jgi:hypothetical protein